MLKLNSDFRRTYGRGKSAADPVLVTYALRNRYGVMRIGITTGKKLGNAVERGQCANSWEPWVLSVYLQE